MDLPNIPTGSFALTGIYAAEVEDLKRRLTNLESYNEKE